MRRDLSHFLVAYALAMAAGLVPVRALHYALAAGLLAFYGFYVWETHAQRRRPRRVTASRCTSTGTPRCRTGTASSCRSRRPWSAS